MKPHDKKPGWIIQGADMNVFNSARDKFEHVIDSRRSLPAQREAATAALQAMNAFLNVVDIRVKNKSTGHTPADDQKELDFDKSEAADQPAAEKRPADSDALEQSRAEVKEASDAMAERTKAAKAKAQAAAAK